MFSVRRERDAQRKTRRPESDEAGGVAAAAREVDIGWGPPRTGRRVECPCPMERSPSLRFPNRRPCFFLEEVHDGVFENECCRVVFAEHGNSRARFLSTTQKMLSYCIYTFVLGLPLLFFFRRRALSCPPSRPSVTTQTDDKNSLKTIMQAPRDDLDSPKDNPFTLSELAQYDGSDDTKPIYVSIKGDPLVHTYSRTRAPLTCHDLVLARRCI